MGDQAAPLHTDDEQCRPGVRMSAVNEKKSFVTFGHLTYSLRELTSFDNSKWPQKV